MNWIQEMNRCVGPTSWGAGKTKEPTMDTDAIAQAPLLQWGSQAVHDVAAERRRQIEVEGWTAEHDDADHDDGTLAAAGAAYALAAADKLHPFSQGDGGFDDEPPPSWPDNWQWKLADPRRMLVKAGALILAEIERIDRSAG